LNLLILALGTGCQKKAKPGTAGWTAEQFMKLYLQEVNQQEAKKYSTGLAIQKLNDEITSAQTARTPGEVYTANRAKFGYRLKENRREDKREVFIYTISLTMDDNSTHPQDFLVSLIKENGKWKVNNYDYFK
jgi:hypothetical protein